MLGFDCSRLNAIARGEYIRKHVQELKICDERKVQTEVEKNNQPESVKSCISASHDLTEAQKSNLKSYICFVDNVVLI